MLNSPKNKSPSPDDLQENPIKILEELIQIIIRKHFPIHFMKLKISWYQDRQKITKKEKTIDQYPSLIQMQEFLTKH